MPAKIIKGLNGKYSVRTPNRIHGTGMTLENAKKQRNLLNAVEHGWEPTLGHAQKKGMQRGERDK